MAAGFLSEAKAEAVVTLVSRIGVATGGLGESLVIERR